MTEYIPEIACVVTVLTAVVVSRCPILHESSGTVYIGYVSYICYIVGEAWL